MKIPSLILKQLYTFGSLENAGGNVSFGLKNRLSDARVTGIRGLRINDAVIPVDDLHLDLGEGAIVPAREVDEHRPLDFPLRRAIRVLWPKGDLGEGKHRIQLDFHADPFGSLSLKVEDAMSRRVERRVSVPYDKTDDYAAAAVHARQAFAEQYSNVKLEHIRAHSFSPEVVRGNIENFTGVVQVPLGLAGPLHVRGEHADGEFLIPLATSEGTLVASYNRGIKVLNLSGGVRSTVLDDAMQRAPVFEFDSAREARDFRTWVEHNFPAIRDAAEATSRIAKLKHIESYLSHRFAFLRFNYLTGDAAGQNMVGRATFAACSWILDHHPAIRRFYLESNLATDKKASQVNVMHTRGKRVVAEAVIPRDVLVNNMRVEPEALFHHYNISNVGAILSGANNNGAHSPNAITALFIATGQDVANVSESSAGIVFCELTEARDLYMSITIPSLIVATYGGGTQLPTQAECLDILGCRGHGKVKKFAEIVAGVVLAGELSLAAAISSLDWVSSHEKYGRNR